MRRKPGHIGAFNEARPQAQHLGIFVDPRAGRFSRERCRGARPLGNRLFFSFPYAVIPLTNESGPILDQQLNRLAAHPERGLLIATCRGCQQVKAIKPSRWKRDCLAVRSDGIGRTASGGSQMKANAGILDRSGQHFGRQSLALGLFRPVKGAVEAAPGWSALESGDRYIIWQDNLLRSYGHKLRDRWSKTKPESVKLE